MRNRKPALPSPWANRPGVTSDHIEAGFWLFQWAKGTPEVPARIWSCDHEPGNSDNKLSTGPYWRAEVAGVEVDPYRVQHGRKVQRLTARQYRHRVALIDYVAEYEPDDPKNRPRRKVNLRTMPPPF